MKIFLSFLKALGWMALGIILLISFIHLEEKVGLINPLLFFGSISGGLYFIFWLGNRLAAQIWDAYLEKRFGEYTGHRFLKFILVFSLLLFITLFAFHIIMSVQLAPIKKEFKSITLATQPRELLDDSVVSGVKLDYKGELDAVIAKRDAMLEKHGYDKIGKWWVTSEDADTARIVYLKDFTKIFRKGG
ncbi:hypothetical protein JXB28_00345 [Candidatus Woesearchaeota archaeon]|nr:hypothetical protein [Candidatus Woesearchaeota archaeon]